MHTLLTVLFLSCAAAQLFPLCTESRAISQITCILLWKIHDIWRCNIMGKQWKTVHMMPVLPVLAEHKRLRSHPTNYWTLVMQRLKQIQAAIDHLWQSSISNIKIIHRHTQSKWNILLMTVDCVFYIQIYLRWLEDRKLIWLRYDFMFGFKQHRYLSEQGGRYCNPCPSY